MSFDTFSKHDDGFAILNFRAQFQWKTTGSISFALRSDPSSNAVVGEFGWIDVHATNDDWRRIIIRVCLPHSYLQYADCLKVVDRICEQLSLPTDSYKATFISPLKQFSFDNGFTRDFVSQGPPSEPDDNSWDDRAGVSPLEIISRESAFGMLLAAFPEFHHRVDREKGFDFFRGIEAFLDCSLVFVLVDALKDVVKKNDEPQLRRLFDVIEKLVVFGDDYTRNGTLSRAFELIHQSDILARTLASYMLPKTLEKSTKVKEEMEHRGNNPMDRSGGSAAS
jgi:hypothetical protein